MGGFLVFSCALGWLGVVFRVADYLLVCYSRYSSELPTS